MLLYIFMLLIKFSGDEVGKEEWLNNDSKVVYFIAGAAAYGLGAQVSYSQGRAGEDCTG